jgi:hypothetical protein
MIDADSAVKYSLFCNLNHLFQVNGLEHVKLQISSQVKPLEDEVGGLGITRQAFWEEFCSERQAHVHDSVHAIVMSNRHHDVY